MPIKNAIWCCTIKVDTVNSKSQYPIYRKGETGGKKRWLGINGNTTRNTPYIEGDDAAAR